MRSLALVLGLAPLLSASLAFAADDCPPGSVHKSEDGFGWCEPTVCDNDGQCTPNEVCRPVGLCLEIGTLADSAAGDAGKRLVTTQRCPPDDRCPNTQVCNKMTRCVTRDDADKLGLLTAPSATPAPAGETKKSSCGCELVGTPTGTGTGALALGLAFALTLRRRR